MNGWRHRWVDEWMGETGVMYLLITAVQLCMISNHITSVTFSNKLFMAHASGVIWRSLGSSVDLGWAH